VFRALVAAALVFATVGELRAQEKKATPTFRQRLAGLKADVKKYEWQWQRFQLRVRVWHSNLQFRANYVKFLEENIDSFIEIERQRETVKKGMLLGRAPRPDVPAPAAGPVFD
jgi:hypothetical protein